MNLLAPALHPSPDCAAQATHGRPIQFSIERIGPDQASALLAARRPGAKRNPMAVAMYAQAMAAGEWVLNGMPLILSRSGVLLDGAQRLFACLDSDISFVTVVARDVADDTVHTIDQQRRRSFSGVLETRAVKNPGAVAGLLSKLIRYQDGSLTRLTSTPPWSRMERVMEANQAIIDDAVAFSLDHPARLLTEAVRTPLICMGMLADRAALERLLDAIVTPERFMANEPGVMVRRRLLEGKADRAHRLHPVALFAICIKAFNDTLTGERRESYSWTDIAQNPKAGEAFPAMLNYPGLVEGVATQAPVRQRLALEADHAVSESAVGAGRYTIAVETVGPDRAGAYLAHNMGNRNVVASHVQAMVRDIQNGRWMVNAQPICFAQSGRLLNGQHRLNAVLEAGQEIEVAIMHGLPEEAFETFDKQAKKAPAVDDLFADFGDKPLISAAAVLLWRREMRPAGQPNARPTAAEVQDVIRDNPELMRLRAFARKMVRYGRSSAMLYAAHRVLQDNPVLGMQFLEKFETGAELAAGHPVLRLRDRLLDLRGHRADQNTQIDEILAAWGRFQKL